MYELRGGRSAEGAERTDERGLTAVRLERPIGASFIATAVGCVSMMNDIHIPTVRIVFAYEPRQE